MSNISEFCIKIGLLDQGSRWEGGLGAWWKGGGCEVGRKGVHASDSEPS